VPVQKEKCNQGKPTDPIPTELPQPTAEQVETKAIEPVVKSPEPSTQPQRPVAHFVRDLNLPDGVGVVPGETLKKGWEFENPSTTAWPEGSKLVFSLGSKELLVDSVEEFPVPLAKPGEKVQVSCPIRVPNKPGRFQASFILVDKDKIPFEGHRCWVQLMIAEDEKKSAPAEPEDPKPEAPKPEEPKPEAPKPEAPKPEPEAPKPEAPKPEAPKPEPKSETPKPEAPKPETKEAPKPAEPTKPVEAKAKPTSDPALLAKYKNELKTLEGMGFSQIDLNVSLLQKFKGSIERVVTGLIEKSH